MTKAANDRKWKGLVAMFGATMLFSTGSSCSSDSLRAVVIGLDAAANQIEQDNRDISFGDWLSSELDDL